ncbi:MAG: protein translocase subunit SecD [Burkholderiales bacterium]|nr:protein translocase subunit SecD [Phycisphaerae bacterium]
MQTTYTNRVFWILVTLWIAVSAIYPRVPGTLFWFFDVTGPISFQDNLKPGIDIKGGASLIYEIKQTDTASADPKLSETVATALRKRVDPQGVRNIIWRPQGPTRLEIQLPASRNTEQAEAVRNKYIAAKDQLDQTNLRVVSVVGDLETLSGAERDAKIKEYAADSAKRAEILPKLASLADTIKQARADKQPAVAAEARLAYEPLQEALGATNLSINQLESALDLNGDDRTKRLAEIRKQFPDFPSRLKAIEVFAEAYDAFLPLRDKIDDVARLKRDLRGSGVLSFNILVDGDSQDATTMLQRLQQEGPRSHPGDVARWFLVDRPDEIKGNVALREYNGKFYALAYIDPDRSIMNGEGLPHWGLASASRQFQDGQRVVGFQFDTVGSKLCADLTGKYRKTSERAWHLGIVLDEKMYSAPIINGQLFGSGIITGDYSESEQEYLVSTLAAGALPAQLTDEPISEKTIGPQLGADNLKAGLISCVAGLIIVAVFMISYYYLSGVVALIAVLINLLLIVGAMAVINATFTLPGIAGIVLSVAMAVDANVLIFERLREEQARGLSLKMALRNSYDRAFSAIFDSQVTTAISSVFLFWFGSEEVRGFGLTLLIGIVTSLFTALFVTRTIFGILVDKFGLSDLSSLPRTFPRWNTMLTPRQDWIKLSWIFVTFSALFIGTGMTMFFTKLGAGQALDIEFTGGTSVQVELVAAADREDVQKQLDAQSKKRPDLLASPRAVAVGKERREYSISTPTIDTRAVQQGVLEALGDKLKISKPSKFELVDSDYDTAFNRAIYPIENAQTRIEGIPPYLLGGHVGGVALVLNNIDPPLTEQEMRSRIDQRLLQQENNVRPERVEIETFDGGRRAVVLMSDSRYAYNASDSNALQQWRASLASQAWSIAGDAINNPPQLRGVTSFNAQVADEAKWNTIMAMSMSVLGIMAYIWVRFGNLKFGTATVIACIHDALFVIAAIGMSFYIGQIRFFEEVLLIKPFRLDLTLVAAVLTVVGYSMNDTVVVFDRIRENRGKFGLLSRQVINDSINQTFSRTLLTGGTSIGILLVMYVIGGEGIHAFTFAMLLGILVGTYSSIAVAAPLLLIGKSAEAPAGLAKVRPAARGLDPVA